MAKKKSAKPASAPAATPAPTPEPVATAKRRPGEPSDSESKLTLILPKEIVQKAKHRAVDEGTTVKAIILRALQAELG